MPSPIVTPTPPHPSPTCKVFMVSALQDKGMNLLEEYLFDHVRASPALPSPLTCHATMPWSRAMPLGARRPPARGGHGSSLGGPAGAARAGQGRGGRPLAEVGGRAGKGRWAWGVGAGVRRASGRGLRWGGPVGSARGGRGHSPTEAGGRAGEGWWARGGGAAAARPRRLGPRQRGPAGAVRRHGGRLPTEAEGRAGEGPWAKRGARKQWPPTRTGHGPRRGGPAGVAWRGEAAARGWDAAAARSRRPGVALGKAVGCNAARGGGAAAARPRRPRATPWKAGGRR
ncbi:unnamed protein product [Closterium sp. NIES-64]|nr:unnamed protein product [Closterium sp. NIES-64]